MEDRFIAIDPASSDGDKCVCVHFKEKADTVEIIEIHELEPVPENS